jgi:P-type E1-E2 ATPase
VNNDEVTVVRGKHHATQKVSVWDLVVGDIVLLETGQRVPADCVIIESSDLKIDESPNDDKTQEKSKSALDNSGN